jgi:hypothetical protein
MADEAAVQQDLRAALAEAVNEVPFADDDQGNESWDAYDDAVEPVEPAAGDGSEPSTAETGGEETTPEAEAQEFEVPEFYRKTLEGLPEEKQKEVLTHLQQQESFIHQLQERLAAKPEAPEAPADAPLDEDVSDEALAIALGYDPEDAYNQPSKVELQLARTVLALEDRVEGLAQVETTRQVETAWNSGLDQLESEYGKLPVSRVDVLRYAIEEGIASPFEAYFRIAAPARAEVEGAVAAATKAAAKKAEGGGVKPRATAGEPDSNIKKGMSLNDAVKAAMAETEKEKGVRLRSLFGKKASGNGPVFN